MYNDPGPIRRAQLIAPFGVGALVVGRDGVGLISGGLDHWYENEDGNNEGIDTNEFQFEEWRLQKVLKVNHFRLPPDHRTRRFGNDSPNVDLTVPFLRFPTWHFCPACGRLEKRTLSERGWIKCPDSGIKHKVKYMYQVPFVAICSEGHIQDFPWREWVHKNPNSTCERQMYLVSTGGATLAGQKIKCDCGEERSLSRITETISEDNTKTFLSTNLVPNGPEYLCNGGLPWVGNEEKHECGQHLRGSLRSASNLYFAQVKSSIYIPRYDSDKLGELVTLFDKPPISTFINLCYQIGKEVTPQLLKLQQPAILHGYSDNDINEALRIVLEGLKVLNNTDVTTSDDPQTSFRREEYNVLLHSQDRENLVIKELKMNEYEKYIQSYFSSIMLVEKLQETRVFVGFTRIFPDNNQTLEKRKSLLWKNQPGTESSWLPAYIVYGEGIFLLFNENLLREWETRKDVGERLKPLQLRYNRMLMQRKLIERNISPRFVLVHTFSHILMNRLTFECGYNSSALRERLYVSTDPHYPMAGLLIYTAAGDSEGTMGGLVRMGKPGYLEPTIRRALESALWCSADPVCMEIGGKTGQGPDSCNLAACHNCALVPETACEEFNRFLDRGLVIGETGKNQLGYFVKSTE